MLERLSVLVEGIKNSKIKIKEGLDMHQFCSFWGAFDILSYISDAVTLVHGPTGCLGNRRFLPVMGHHNSCDVIPHLSTVFTNNEVIFGGERKLIDSILSVLEKYNPRLIFVLTNCCADIIGDDIEGCIESLPANLKNKVSYLNTGGYSGKSYRRGAEMAFHLLVELMAGKPSDPRPGTVNLFLRRWIWDETEEMEIAEILRMLKMIGVNINKVFRREFTLNDLFELKNAEANVALCFFFGISFFREMQDKFNMPFVNESFPMGIEATRKWLKAILSLLGKEYDFSTLDELQQLEEKRDKLINRLGRNRPCVIWTQTGERMIALTKLAQELCLETIVVGVDPAAVRDKICIFEREIGNGFDTNVFVSSYIEDVRELLKDLEDPIVFCNDNFFYEYPVFQYRLASNQIYGLSGTNRIYDAVYASLDKRPGKYSLFVKG